MHAGAQICANVHKTQKIYEQNLNALRNLLIDLQRSGLHQIIACVYTDSHTFTYCAWRYTISSKCAQKCTKENKNIKESGKHIDSP